MGMTRASQLDRRIQFYRKTLIPDGQGGFDIDWSEHGGRVSALRTDISDSEKYAQGKVSSTVVSRFLVRSSEFARGILPADRLTCEGLDYNITGVKQATKYGRQQLIEITAEAYTDGQ